MTPPGSQFRAPSRLLLKITDYLSLLPTFPGSDNCTQGVPVPWYGWKAYELSWFKGILIKSKSKSYPWVWATTAPEWQISAYARARAFPGLPAASIGLGGPHRAPIRPPCRKNDRDIAFKRPFCDFRTAVTCIVRHAMRFRCFKLV